MGVVCVPGPGGFQGIPAGVGDVEREGPACAPILDEMAERARLTAFWPWMRMPCGPVA